MRISGNQGRRSVQVSQASGAWHDVYTQGLDIAPPSLVLDFERGVYRNTASGPAGSFATIVTFSRASGKTVTDVDGNPNALSMNEPGFDWSSGRRGLHISSGTGGDAADIVNIPTESWWTGGAGTFVLDATLLANNGSFDRLLDLNNGSNNERISVFYNAGAGQLASVIRAGGSSQAALVGGATAVTLPQALKTAVAFDINDFRFQRNSGPVLSDGSGVLPGPVTQVNLGASFSGNRCEIIVHSLLYFAQSLSNPQLSDLTS